MYTKRFILAVFHGHPLAIATILSAFVGPPFTVPIPFAIVAILIVTDLVGGAANAAREAQRKLTRQREEARKQQYQLVLARERQQIAQQQAEHREQERIRNLPPPPEVQAEQLRIAVNKRLAIIDGADLPPEEKTALRNEMMEQYRMAIERLL